MKKNKKVPCVVAEPCEHYDANGKLYYTFTPRVMMLDERFVQAHAALCAAKPLLVRRTISIEDERAALAEHARTH